MPQNQKPEPTLEEITAQRDQLLDVCNGMADLIARCGIKVNKEFEEALFAAIERVEGKA